MSDESKKKEPDVHKMLSDLNECYLDDIERSKEMINGILSRAGIIPSLETFLAYRAGFHVGSIWVDSAYKHGEPQRQDLYEISEDLRDDVTFMRREHRKSRMQDLKE